MTDNKTPSPETRLMGHSLTSPSHGRNSRLGDQNDDRPKDSLACSRDGSCVCGNDHSTPVVWQLRHGGQDGHDWVYGDPARPAFGDFSSGAFSGSVLSAAILPRQNGDPVAYRHRLAGSSEWNVSNAGDMDGVRECMRHLGDQLEIEPLFAMAKSGDKPAGSRSKDEASLPTTFRLSQLEARTSCAASVNDQLTLPRPQPQDHVDLRKAAWSLINDLDRSLVGSRDIAVIHATNTSVKRLRLMLDKLDREAPSPETKPIGFMDVDGLGTLVDEVRARPASSPAPQDHLVGGHLRAQGVGRDPENDRVVFLSLNRVPSDDELRAIRDGIQRTPATCPFCTKPTYVLPCSHCGEPDVPDNSF